MDIVWLALGIVTFATAQFVFSRLPTRRARLVAPWLLAVASAYATAALVPLPPDREVHGWPSLDPSYLLTVGTAWSLLAFESVLVGQWLLRKPRGLVTFTLLCSAGTFFGWALTLWTVFSLMPS